MRRKHFRSKSDANERDRYTKKQGRKSASIERTNEEILKVKQATKTCHICLRDFELRIFFTNIIPLENKTMPKEKERLKRPSHLFNNLLSLHDLYTLMPFTPQIPNCASIRLRLSKKQCAWKCWQLHNLYGFVFASFGNIKYLKYNLHTKIYIETIIAIYSDSQNSHHHHQHRHRRHHQHHHFAPTPHPQMPSIAIAKAVFVDTAVLLSILL